MDFCRAVFHSCITRTGDNRCYIQLAFCIVYVLFCVAAFQCIACGNILAAALHMDFCCAVFHSCITCTGDNRCFIQITASHMGNCRTFHTGSACTDHFCVVRLLSVSCHCGCAQREQHRNCQQNGKQLFACLVHKQFLLQ